MSQPNKFWIEKQVTGLAEQFPYVWWVQMFSNSHQREYTARVLLDVEGEGWEIKVTDKQWNYHLMIQELEKRLNEVCYEREIVNARQS